MKQFSGFLYDYKILEDPTMTVLTNVRIRRTWRERLFSIPWQPWTATREVIQNMPSDKIITFVVDGQHVAVMHPNLASNFRKSFSLNIDSHEKKEG